MSNYVPLQDYVLIQKTAADLKRGTILLPESHQPKNRGIVVAVGPGLRSSDGRLIPVNLMVGQKVMFNRAIEVEADFLLVKESEILAVVQ